MCLQFQNAAMLDWLKTQVRVIEAWREDVSRARPDANIDAIIATPADLVEAANNDLATAARDAGMVDEVETGTIH